MDIDFTPYEKYDRTKATVGMYDLYLAINQDSQAQGRGEIAPYDYTKRIHRAYTMKNADSFRKAASFGERFKAEGFLPKGASRNGGGDLAKAIAYVLKNEGRYEWPAVRAFVKTLGKPFTRLLELVPMDDRAVAEHKAREAMRSMGDTIIIADELRRIADMVEPYQKEYFQLVRSFTKKDQELVEMATTNKKLKSLIKDYQERTEQFLDRIADEEDLEARGKMVKQLSIFQQEFKFILKKAGLLD